MTDASHQTLDGVVGLMAERRRYEDWIAALDAKRATTPQHVFERVRLDYETRLQAVLQKLALHRGELEQQVKILADRLASLKTEERQRLDERAELDLRAQVGELTEAQYQEAVRTLDEAIKRIANEQASLDMDLGRTREFLLAANAGPATAGASQPAPVSRLGAQVSAPSAPATPRYDPPPAPPRAATAQPSPAAPAAGQRPPARAPDPSQTAAPTNFDELAFLNSVVGPGEKGRRGQQPPEPIGLPDPMTGLNVTRDEPATLGESLLERVNRPAPSNDIIRQEPLDALAGHSKRNEAETPMAANVTGNNPIVLRGGEAAHGKTLKCSECAAMNYPTEWYCERCGAELASL